jgi:hypothetical protein
MCLSREEDILFMEPTQMAFTLSTEVVEVVRTGSKSNDLGV